MKSEPWGPLAVETVGLTKQYGDLTAVDDLDLEIRSGSVFGFIGPNGAGKSTTIKTLMGLTRKTGGQARVLGFDVDERATAMRQNVGYVPETHTVYPWMRVEEAIRFCRSFYTTWNDGFCRELQGLFELDGRKKVGHLSKGTLAKLGLLLAISHEPELLILDEPTGGLDPLIREEFLDGVLRAICDRPQTVLLSSHTMSDVQRLADTVGILHEGKLLVSAPTEELLGSTKRVRAVMDDGSPSGDPPEGTIWQRSEKREWLMTIHGFSSDSVEYLRGQYPIEHLEVFDLGLEEIFKDFIKGRRVST